MKDTLIDQPKYLSVASKSQANWLVYQRRWRTCRQCPLGIESSDGLNDKYARHVLARGHIPCHVLFIGEAPGVSEEDLGVPFIGPAGKLLDRMISDARNGLANDLKHKSDRLKLCFANLICCTPWDTSPDARPNQTREPAKDEIDACRSHLAELVLLAKPKAIVRVGKLAQKHVGSNLEGVGDAIAGGKLVAVDIIHPAFFLHDKGRDKGRGADPILEWKRSMLRLRKLFTTLLS